MNDKPDCKWLRSHFLCVEKFRRGPDGTRGVPDQPWARRVQHMVKTLKIIPGQYRWVGAVGGEIVAVAVWRHLDQDPAFVHLDLAAVALDHQHRQLPRSGKAAGVADGLLISAGGEMARMAQESGADALFVECEVDRRNLPSQALCQRLELRPTTTGPLMEDGTQLITWTGRRQLKDESVVLDIPSRDDAARSRHPPF
jgi:hypothetical protein